MNKIPKDKIETLKIEKKINQEIILENFFCNDEILLQFLIHNNKKLNFVEIKINFNEEEIEIIDNKSYEYFYIIIQNTVEKRIFQKKIKLLEFFNIFLPNFPKKGIKLFFENKGFTKEIKIMLIRKLRNKLWIKYNVIELKTKNNFQKSIQEFSFRLIKKNNLSIYETNIEKALKQKSFNFSLNSIESVSYKDFKIYPDKRVYLKYSKKNFKIEIAEQRIKILIYAFPLKYFYFSLIYIHFF